MPSSRPADADPVDDDVRRSQGVDDIDDAVRAEGGESSAVAERAAPGTDATGRGEAPDAGLDQADDSGHRSGDATGALRGLGWYRHRALVDAVAAAELAALDETKVGRVRRVDRGECDVLMVAGEVRALSDSTRSQGELAPATGDWVVVDLEGGGLGARIERILPRRTAIVRRDPAEEVIEQVLVANVDVVGAVAGRDRPLRVARIERFLVLAADSGADSMVVVTKADVRPDPSWAADVELLGDLDVAVTSAQSGDGIAELRSRIADDATLVLLGESGSGKSTLVNALVGEEVLATGAVRERDRKGRHTTTARELLLVPGGGILIDTPGVRSVGLWADADAIDRVFVDIADLAAACRFSDCAHRSEPGCAVRAAVDDGELDGRRLERYLRLVDELADQADQREVRRRRRRS